MAWSQEAQQRIRALVACIGQAQLADGQAGAALRWLQDAQEQVAGAEAAGKVFDRALPVTGYAAREHYAEDLTCLLAQLTRKAWSRPGCWLHFVSLGASSVVRLVSCK